MAISKNQPMRPALIDAVDTINNFDLDEIDSLINAVSDLETTVGDNSSGLVKDVSDLETTVTNMSIVPLVTDLITVAPNAIVEMPDTILDDYNFLLILSYTPDGTRNTCLAPNSNIVFPCNSPSHNNNISWKKTTSEIIAQSGNSENVNIRFVFGLKISY